MKKLGMFFVVLVILLGFFASVNAEGLITPEDIQNIVKAMVLGGNAEKPEESPKSIDGCNEEPEKCHSSEYVDFKKFPGKSYTPETNGDSKIPCFITEAQGDGNGEKKCVGSEGEVVGCYCYKIESHGKCDKNTACEGKSGIGKNFKRPCQCGNGMVICDDTNPYCLENTGEIFSDKGSCESKKTIADDCDNDCEYEGDPNRCKNLPCEGGSGKCVVDEKEEGGYEGRCEGSLLCGKIPRAECFERVNQKAGWPMYKNMFVEATDYDGVEYMAYSGDTAISGYPYYRFPSNAELKKIEDDIGEIYDWKGFQDDYLGDSDTLRRKMCGNPDKNIQCIIKVAPVSFDFFDAFFGPVDPRANWIWEKTGLAEGWSETVAFTDNWTLNNVFGEDVAKMADLTTYVCESNIRKPKPESQTGVEPPTVIGDLSLTVNGQKSPLLPDNTTLYEMSWMIFNHQVSGQVLYRVYAKDSTLSDWKDCSIFAVNEGAEVKDIELEEGSTDYGYYAFYSSNSASFDEDKCDHAVNIDEGCITYIEEYGGDLEGAYNGDYDMEHYCQKFVPEVYDGSFDIQEVDTTDTSGDGLW